MGKCKRLGSALGVMILALLLGVAFAELYTRANLALSQDRFERGWVGAVLVNSAVAAVVLARATRRRSRRAGTAWPARAEAVVAVPGSAFATLQRWLLARPWRVYAPATAIVAAAVLVSAYGRLQGLAPALAWTWSPWARVTWVPVVEEVVFRLGFSNALRGLAGRRMGTLASALLFALIHGSWTPAHLAAGMIALPLGPFLGGLIFDGIYQTTGRLRSSIALHAAFNTTAILLGWDRFH